MNSSIDIEGNVKRFVAGDGRDPGRGPIQRFASFDYCFNHFQAFRDSGTTSALAEPPNLVPSCLHLGFYLASWGMLRGSSYLLQRSARFFVPVVRAIAATPLRDWEIDAHTYSPGNVQVLLALAGRLRAALTPPEGPPPFPTDILVTKTMLGVFGNVPAFDSFFCAGSGLRRFGQPALEALGGFYRQHAGAIEEARRALGTYDFESGEESERFYTRAKVLDMVFWVEGR